jgi:hypothetical protein
MSYGGNIYTMEIVQTTQFKPFFVLFLAPTYQQTNGNIPF